MRLFTELFMALDATTATNEKVAALLRYLQSAEEKDIVWCIALFCDKRPRRPVNTALMRQWAAEEAHVPEWLFEESYHIVGDLGETIALLVPRAEQGDERPLHQWMHELDQLRAQDDATKKDYVIQAWQSLDKNGKFIFNKLIGGSFRLGASRQLMIKALAKWTEMEANALAHALTGNWSPFQTSLHDLLHASAGDRSKPYPFYLAHPLEQEPTDLGNVNDWQIEYKWDGIRGQVVVREGETFVWSRGEELVTEKFPELVALGKHLPDGAVLDGEIVVHDGEQPLPFALLQTRIGRKNVSRAAMQKAPVRFIAYDLLEHRGEDVRGRALHERRALLEQLCEEVNRPELLLSVALNCGTWQEAVILREQSREKQSEGLMLKWKQGIYETGRKRGEWWKWKVDALTIDAVMIYAMQGHGRRANLFTDYTFAVWKDDQLVPFAKAYSGLSDAEIKEVDAWVKSNTLEKFGPVRSVKAELVFEIGFEGIQESTRHKSGIALRFPRIVRWRKDKPATEANTIHDLRAFL